MADTTQTLALLTLAQNYRGRIVGQINRRSVLLKLLPFVLGEGKNCAFSVEADGMVAENYAEGADAANFGSDAQAAAVLNWGQYRSNFHISGLAISGARRSISPDGVQNLIAHNMVKAATKLASLINGALFTGPGTGTTIAGLDVAIGDDTNTYAGIDRAANAYWRPTVVDPGVATAPTFALIRSDVAAIYTASGVTPDVAVCSPNVFNKVGSLFDANRRYIQDIQTARGQVRLDASLGALELDGMFFVKDKDATANRIHYLNTNHIRIEYLPTADQAVMDAMLQMDMQTDDGYGLTPLGMLCELLAKNGDSRRYQCKSYIQLVCDRPNTCGVRKNVSTS